MKKVFRAFIVTLICLVAGFWIFCNLNHDFATQLGLASGPGKPADTAAAPEIVETFDGNFKTYYEMSDGMWQADGRMYQYRLEISGRMPNASKDSTFVYLSNLESISFEQAWKAAGLSSSLEDYFSADEAILVEWNTK